MSHFPFAPGVVERTRRTRRSAIWPRLGLFLCQAGFVLATVVTLGILACTAVALLSLGLFDLEIFEGARLL